MSIIKKSGVGLKYMIHLKFSSKLEIDAFVLKVDLVTPEFDSIPPMVEQSITYKSHLNLDPGVLFESGLFFDRIVLHLVRNKNIDRWIYLSTKLFGSIEESGIIASGFMYSPEKLERISLDNVKIKSKLENEITVSVDYKGSSF